MGAEAVPAEGDEPGFCTITRGAPFATRAVSPPAGSVGVSGFTAGAAWALPGSVAGFVGAGSPDCEPAAPSTTEAGSGVDGAAGPDGVAGTLSPPGTASVPVGFGGAAGFAAPGAAAAGLGGAGRSGLMPPSQLGPVYISGDSPLAFHFSSKSAAALFEVSPVPTTWFQG